MANQDVNAEPENALTSAKDRATSPVLEQTDRSIERGKETDTVLSAAPPDRLNLRPAVVSLSPIYEAVTRSFAVGNGARSVMGSLPSDGGCDVVDIHFGRSADQLDHSRASAT
jgi:hypothetical protein